VSLSIFREPACARKECLEKRWQRDDLPEGDCPVVRACNIHFELSESYDASAWRSQGGGLIPRRDLA
jgi:hypothetical protein